MQVMHGLPSNKRMGGAGINQTLDDIENLLVVTFRITSITQKSGAAGKQGIPALRPRGSLNPVNTSPAPTHPPEAKEKSRRRCLHTSPCEN